MKKRMVSVVLAALILSSCIVPAMAYHEGNDALSGIEYALNNEIETVSDVEFRSYMDKICDSYTITFQEDNLSSEVPNNRLLTAEVSKETAKAVIAHNKKAAQQAKSYVMSLNLKAAGYAFIEESCLEELERYEKMDDFQILSYTIHVPKNNSNSQVSTLAAPPANFFYFGTYGGRDFYFYYPSTTNGKTTNYKQISQSVLQQWVNNAVNLVMVFADIRVSAGFSAFQALMGAPKNYTVKTGAFTENYFNANVHTRGIYTLYGNGTYQMLTSQQYAEIYPYAVFHPVDSPAYGAHIQRTMDMQDKYSLLNIKIALPLCAKKHGNSSMVL